MLILTDTRNRKLYSKRLQDFDPFIRLTGVERAVYLFCETGRTLRQIVEHVAEAFRGSPPDEPAIVRMLDAWIAARLMAHLDGRYLSLAMQTMS